MKKFIIKFAIFISIVVVVDFGLSKILEFGRPNDYAAFIESKRDFDSLNKIDILFLGDSVAADSLVPSIFSRTLNVQAFNYCVYASSPFENYYLLKDLLARHDHLPKVVILGTNIQMFNYNVSSGRYTPLFISKPINLIPLLLKGQSFGSFTSSGRRIFLLPSLMKKIVNNSNVSNSRRYIQKFDNGYLQNLKHYSDKQQLDCIRDTNTKKMVSIWRNEIIDDQIVYFKKIISFLQQKNIHVIIANPPLNRKFLDCIKSDPMFKKFQSILEEIESTTDVDIFNMDYKLLQNVLIDEDFLDADHLCYSGAKKFSKSLSEHLLDLKILAAAN